MTFRRVFLNQQPYNLEVGFLQWFLDSGFNIFGKISLQCIFHICNIGLVVGGGFPPYFWWLPPPTTPFGNHNWWILLSRVYAAQSTFWLYSHFCRGLQSSVASVDLCLQSLCDRFQWSWIYWLSRSPMEHWIEFSKLERSPCHRWIAKRWECVSAE